ncbi:MAG: D-alanyl-D-alanine carboxypeptidase family protein [Syntrophomonadaceae bacterium]|nr:D-alanyl-D-alanine carboxypeptidase family protein [Syntrophomonadaceae bacterium]
MEKRILRVVLLTIVLLCLAGGTAAAAEPDFDIHARGVYMVNTDSGEAVYAKDADKVMYPASLTKIITAILALESVKHPAQEQITVPEGLLDDLYVRGASQVGLIPGEVVNMQDLLYAAMLPSGCDAALVIAWHLGQGDVDAFIKRMNDRARELGALNTNFVNPHGLHEPAQVSTPYDIYKLSSHALSMPEFREIVSSPVYTMQATNKNEARRIYSTNALMDASNSWHDERVSGIKSGFTSQAGRCLVSSASFDGSEYLLVVMGANLDQPPVSSIQPNMAYRDTVNLYDWAFENFTLYRLTTKGEVLSQLTVKGGKQKTVDLLAGSDCSTLLEAGENPIFINTEFNVVNKTRAPIEKGQLEGKVNFTLNGEALGSVDLLTAQEVKRAWLKPIVITLLVILALIYFIDRFRRRRREKSIFSGGEPRQYQDLAR